MAKKKKPKGFANVPGMRGRRKGGRHDARPDGFDRSASSTLASLADAWLAYLEQRAYSRRTVEKTRWCLRDFLAWCQLRDLSDPDAITKSILESYQRHLFHYRRKNQKSLSVTTQRDRLGTLQRFFAWLCKQNHLPANPAADLELPRKPARSLPKALSTGELDALFAMIDTADVLGIRDRCMLEFFYSCGLRRSELTALDIEDVNAQADTVTVRKGKGGKDRVLPLGGPARHWFERYRDESRPRLELDIKERALFLSGYGERLNPNYVGNWVKSTMRAAGIEKAGSCHLLRHSCATHMHEGGADIRIIQVLLGHARLDTTQIYTEVSIGQLREVHARTHPHGGETSKSRDKPAENC